MYMTLGNDIIVDLNHIAKHREDLWQAPFRCHVHGVTARNEAAVDLEYAAEHLEALWCHRHGVFGRHVCGVT